jgi:hypothetical protein
MISRTAWGAAAPRHDARGEWGLYDAVLNRGGYRVYTEPLSDILRAIVIHHSASAVTDSPASLQALHFDRQRFADIGYHFVIGGDGALYEGRPITVRGAHVGGHNTGAIGICLTGNFERIQPAHEQLATLTTLVTALRNAFGITHLAGHRDYPGQNTLCPGRNLHPRLQPLAEDARLIFGAKT